MSQIKVLSFLNSRRISLQTAVDEIKDLAMQPGNTAWIVGAGLSAGAVPLAGQMVELLLKDIPSDVTSADVERVRRCKRPEIRYEKAFRLYSGDHKKRDSGDRKQREEQRLKRGSFVRSIVERSKITHANFLLAALLKYSSLKGLVVTPNFDDCLSRALNWLDAAPVYVCDMPEGAERLIHAKEIQILHVHGSYWHYDAANLQSELRQRARMKLAVTRERFNEWLKRAFQTRLILVLGYAGWERDVIMTALKGVLEEQKKDCLIYWFVFNLSDFTAPVWLDDKRVQFVGLEEGSLPADWVLDQLCSRLIPETQQAKLVPIAGGPLTQTLKQLDNDVLSLSSTSLKSLIQLKGSTNAGMLIHGEFEILSKRLQDAIRIFKDQINPSRDKARRMIVALKTSLQSMDSSSLPQPPKWLSQKKYLLPLSDSDVAELCMLIQQIFDQGQKSHQKARLWAEFIAAVTANDERCMQILDPSRLGYEVGRVLLGHPENHWCSEGAQMILQVSLHDSLTERRYEGLKRCFSAYSRLKASSSITRKSWRPHAAWLLTQLRERVKLGVPVDDDIALLSPALHDLRMGSEIKDFKPS